MGDILEIIKDFAKKNIKVFAGTLIIIFIFLLVLFPYIDANFLVFNRISNRIDILDKVSQLDYDVIKQNPVLEQEYESILNEIHNIQDKSISFVTSQQQSTNDYYIKFVSGGLLFWGIGLAVLFKKDKDKTVKLSKRLFNRLMSVVLCILIGWGCAFISTKIPTIGSVWANAILFPVVLIATIALFVYGLTKKS